MYKQLCQGDQHINLPLKQTNTSVAGFICSYTFYNKRYLKSKLPSQFHNFCFVKT